MSKIVFTEEELCRFINNQVLIGLNDIPEGSIVAKHSVGTSDIDKGKYSSWAQWWEDNIVTPLKPSDSICPCCQRKIIEDDSNYFVVGHIHDAHSNKGYVCPVCNQCNTAMKKWEFLVAKSMLHERPKNL